MFYCPYCGTQLELEETFCLTCGKEMTKHIKGRIKHDNTFNRYWFIPIISLAICLTIITTYYFVQNYRMVEAKKLYDLGEQHLNEEKYDAAITSFKEALAYKDNFTQAEVALQFAKKALK